MLKSEILEPGCHTCSWSRHTQKCENHGQVLPRQLCSASSSIERSKGKMKTKKSNQKVHAYQWTGQLRAKRLQKTAELMAGGLLHLGWCAIQLRLPPGDDLVMFGISAVDPVSLFLLQINFRFDFLKCPRLSQEIRNQTRLWAQRRKGKKNKSVPLSWKDKNWMHVTCWNHCKFATKALF